MGWDGYGGADDTTSVDERAMTRPTKRSARCRVMKTAVYRLSEVPYSYIVSL